jgi:hypothetical protein
MPKAGLLAPRFRFSVPISATNERATLPEIIWILEKEPAEMIAMALQICLAKHTLIHTLSSSSAGTGKQTPMTKLTRHTYNQFHDDK